jgi:predicted TIM-barrel fold metal-dependent hydrolase
MSQVDFQYFDCDNHFYEPLDAFTRHIEPAFRKRGMQWVEVDGRLRLMVGEKINRFIPNPTFDPISKPGQLDEYFRGRNPDGQGTRELFGELDRMIDHPEYRDRECRLALMDEQGMGAAIFLPTLGVGMEQALIDDPEAIVAVFRAFNRWMVEDWGFSYKERIFAAPIFSLVDPAAATAELEWALEHDARFILMVPGPVMTPGGGYSPADPRCDAFWQLVNDSGVSMVVHGGDSWYSQYMKDWGTAYQMEAFRQNPFRALSSPSSVQDFFASLIALGHFHRFPNLRLASIETGTDWVFHLWDKMTKTFGQVPQAFAEDPRETFKRHVWVSPYYEDDLGKLRQLIGSDRILMGSDYPHAEGLADPSAYIADLKHHDYPDDECRRIMLDNGRGLSVRRPVAAAVAAG